MGILKKAYFVIMLFATLSQVAMILLADEMDMGAVMPREFPLARDYLAGVVDLIMTVGIFGFAFNRAIATRLFWRVVVVINAFLFIQAVILDWGFISGEGMGGLLTTLGIGITAIVAVAIYAFRSQDLWETKA